jgi:hypothetical protein
VSPNFAHTLCFSEHHLKQFELRQINLDDYKLGATYRRKLIEKGGVCIFVHKNLNYLNTNLSKHCKDQDIEVCGLMLESTILNIFETVAKLLSNNYIMNTYEQSGIYNLTCHSCHKVYVGQRAKT